MTIRTYNNIIDRLKAFADGHYMLRAFTHGERANIDINMVSDYPWMHAEMLSVSPTPGELSYEFEVTFMDRPSDIIDPMEQRREAVSDMMMIALDLVAELRNGNTLFGYDVTVGETPSITPQINEFSNYLTGVSLTLNILVPYNWDACDIPADFAVGGPGGSGGSGSGAGSILLKVNGTDNTVQNILDLVEGSNSELTDRGDGRVRIESTGGGGGGGGVESVTGLNTDNTDPDNPIVRISVDGTTITGSGTPASPLVSPPQATPTLQQVISAGATLTQANTIEGGGFDQTIQNVSKVSVLSTGNQVYQRTSAGNSQALTLNGSVASLFFVTGSTELGFVAETSAVKVVTPAVKATTAVVGNPLVLTNASTGAVEYSALTTASVNDSANRRYLTDAQQTVIGNTSGTNTGDETISTIKTKLGTTTVGENLNILANPSAIRFLRINADNSVSALTAADMRTALGVIDTYVIGSGGVFNPADGLTYYIGSSQSMAAAPSTTAARRRVYVGSARRIVGIDLQVFTTVTGSGETVPVSVRVNNTTDYLIGNMTWNPGANNYALVNNQSLDISLAVNDYWEIKIVCPTWATNPTGVTMQGAVSYQI